MEEGNRKSLNTSEGLVADALDHAVADVVDEVSIEIATNRPKQEYERQPHTSDEKQMVRAQLAEPVFHGLKIFADVLIGSLLAREEHRKDDLGRERNTGSGGDRVKEAC